MVPDVHVERVGRDLVELEAEALVPARAERGPLHRRRLDELGRCLAEAELPAPATRAALAAAQQARRRLGALARAPEAAEALDEAGAHLARAAVAAHRGLGALAHIGTRSLHRLLLLLLVAERVAALALARHDAQHAVRVRQAVGVLALQVARLRRGSGRYKVRAPGPRPSLAHAFSAEGWLARDWEHCEHRFRFKCLTCASERHQGLGLGLDSQFFEYLANLWQILNKII